MPYDARLALRRARRTGVWVCLLTAALAVVFLVGVARQSYWALALPVGVGVLSALSLTFWIGYTIRTVRGIPAEAEHYEGAAARRIALLICAVSLALAVLFLWGLWHGSYWALALPVSAGVLSLLGMVFWIGWAIVTQRTTLDQEPTPEEAAETASPQAPADAAP